MCDTNQSNNGGIIVTTRQIQLTDMPVEIFERIFQYTGYKEVSNMRLVIKKNTKTKYICDNFIHTLYTKKSID